MNNVLNHTQMRMIALCVITGTCCEAFAALPYKISGTVKLGTVGMNNVTVVANNGGGQDQTDSNGLFHVSVPAHWTGQLTPILIRYNFTPASRSFSNVTSNLTCPGFIAVADIPPVIVQGTSTNITTAANTYLNFKLSATDADGVPDTLKWSISAPPESGTAAVLSGSPSSPGELVTIRYTPDQNFSGTDSFNVRVSDGGRADTMTVNVTVGAVVVVPPPPVEPPPPVIEPPPVEPPPSGGTGRTYYVALTGSDSAAGTLTAPFRTIQKAANTALAGDTVIISGGTYNSGSTAASVPILSIPMTKKGAAGAPITFKAAPGQTVIFDGKNGVTTSLVDVRGSYIDFEGLELTGARRTAIVVLDDNQNGVVDAHHINIRLCYAHHNNYDAGYIGGAFRTIGPVQYVVFEDCMSHDNCIGFEIRESPTMSAGQMSVPPIAGNIGYSAALSESQWNSWPGWVAYAGRYNVVRRCLAFNNHLLNEMSDGIGCRYAIECTFEDNISFGNGDDNFDLLGSTRCTVRRNIGFNADPSGSADGDGNGMKVGVRGGLDNVIYNNILFNNPRAGIDVADTERAKVYNNTCVNNSWFGIWFEATRATVSGATVLNNVCKGNTQGNIGHAGSSRIILGDYNCVSDANDQGSSFPAGPHGFISTNPMFSNESLVVNTGFLSGVTIPQRLAFIRNQVYAKLGLGLGSPCVNTAEVIPGITGAILGSAPDRGAVESR